ncbi:MAG: phosphoribosylglycinamide formyltransferase [Firmicutes bacterium]|nr:phosphoribosylglycinamide formyltransferase [Bacillota bacterium]
MSKFRLAVLASGRGSNLQAILDAIEDGRLQAQVAVVISDRGEAPALERARAKHIPAVHINPKDFSDKAAYEQAVADCCIEYQVDLIVLAGYMRILGAEFIRRFPNRIVNIHPALLPSFPGLHAQRQALEYGVRFSGCTVHFVDEGVDSGPIISQAVVPVLPDDTEETLAERILVQEHRIYPAAIQLIVEGRLEVKGRRVLIRDKHGH